jgi:hypothetical protein
MFVKRTEKCQFLSDDSDPKRSMVFTLFPHFFIQFWYLGFKFLLAMKKKNTRINMYLVFSDHSIFI